MEKNRDGTLPPIPLSCCCPSAGSAESFISLPPSIPFPPSLPPSLPHLEQGTEFVIDPRYEVTRRLGNGAYGVVVAAKDTITNTPVSSEGGRGKEGGKDN